MAKARAGLKALNMHLSGNPNAEHFQKPGNKLEAGSKGKPKISPRALMGGSPREALISRILAGAVLRIAPANPGWQAQSLVCFLVRFDD